MTSLSQLETLGNDLAIDSKKLAAHWRGDAGLLTPDLATSKDTLCEADRARRNILTIATRLQALLTHPAEFIQRLANQNQLLASLKWLGEFQVLACIPLIGSIAAKEVADVVGVSETQLCRIVRMTATAGFLHEPQPGHIAHTALSAPFVTNLSYLDATMFLAETAAPSALQMATAAQRPQEKEISSDSAYTIAFNTLQPFQLACVERTRLQRQWSAYRRCVGDVDYNFTELLGRLNWGSLGSVCIVDVCAQSTDVAVALADMYPSLHFVVQICESTASQQNGGMVGGGNGADGSSRRITLQKRVPATAQLVKDAAVYILRLTSTSHALSTQILAELNAHLGVLRANTTATMILAPPLLPEPGTVEPDVEAIARLQDLSLLQLTNECGMELSELIELVSSVHDNKGRLVVVNKLRNRYGATLALAVKYQVYSDSP